jgi:hypothetical protein
MGICLTCLNRTFARVPEIPAQVQPRRPRGIYAVVDTATVINQQQQASPAITAAQLDNYFDTLYGGLLNDPAISGLTLQVHWDTLNPNSPTSANPYEWNIVDDAFAQVTAWDNQNPTQAPKTIQLIVTAGFNRPNGYWRRFPVATVCFKRRLSLLQALAEPRPLPVTRRAAMEPCFRCRGTPFIKAPGKLF